jgi:hypothetical protein
MFNLYLSVICQISQAAKAADTFGEDKEACATDAIEIP